MVPPATIGSFNGATQSCDSILRNHKAQEYSLLKSYSNSKSNILQESSKHTDCSEMYFSSNNHTPKKLTRNRILVYTCKNHKTTTDSKVEYHPKRLEKYSVMENLDANFLCNPALYQKKFMELAYISKEMRNVFEIISLPFTSLQRTHNITKSNRILPFINKFTKSYLTNEMRLSLVLMIALTLTILSFFVTGVHSNEENPLNNHRSGGGVGSASPCPVSEHTCDNLQCIPRDKVCNGYDDCGDSSDEHPGCTPCNVTYYGEVGKSYELDLALPTDFKLPFACHLTFVAVGDIYGDLVQLVFRDVSLGTFRSHHVYGCPGGSISIDEAKRPHIDGYWCGSSNLHNVYYSETNTVSVAINVPEKKNNQIIDDKIFRTRLMYKFLLSAEAVVRFGPWNSAKYLGHHRPHSICDKVFDSCDRRKCRIQSPNYPGMYPRNVTCQYVIRQKTVPYGRHALVSVGQPQNGHVHIRHTDAAECDKTLQLRLDSECDIVGDTLNIYEIDGEKRRLLLRFCGGGIIPRVTSSGAELLLVFQTSAFDNMYFDPSPGVHPGFELDVGVAFVPKNSYLYAEDKCEFTISSFEASKGFFENVAHSLPTDAKCIYNFNGRSDEVIWLHFTRLKSTYNQPKPRDGPHCRTRVTLTEEGVEEPLENSCGHMGVRVCHREQLGPGRNRTRPCGEAESYLTSGSKAALTIHYLLPSAVANLEFRLHYEFVYAGPKVEALNLRQPCDKVITSERSKKGMIQSPANNLLYGKFGQTSLLCKYVLKGKPNEAVRVTFISFIAHNSTCHGGESPLQACGRPHKLKGRGSRLEVSEYPWKGVELPLACLCHGSSLPAALMSFTSNLAINFTVVGMNVFDDFAHFSFELEYEFVEVAECDENRVVQGESGYLTLPLKPPSGPCRGHPWLIKPKKDRYLMVSVPGRVIQGSLQLDHQHSHSMFSRTNYPLPSCSGPELHVYQPGTPKPLSAICVDPDSSETVQVFSQGFRDPWSLDYLNENQRSLLVVMVTRPNHYSQDHYNDKVQIRWVQAAPKWLAERCATECPEVHACISASLFCDGSWHCPTGADESVGTCLMALSPWFWLFFGILFGSLTVVISWWVNDLWNRHKYGMGDVSSEVAIAQGIPENQPESSECQFPQCVDKNYETTV